MTYLPISQVELIPYGLCLLYILSDPVSYQTAASIYAFFKAMVLFPEVQAKAQAEIDAVVGNNRLPSFDDRERLPYINALVLEVSRWHVVAPTGLQPVVQLHYLILQI